MILSCVKAYGTSSTFEGLKVIRECCGAHGYSNFSGIINVLSDSSPNPTLEGDNHVMYQ
jgi:acyl-CoA oxidase